jgi:hypothetical protein
MQDLHPPQTLAALRTLSGMTLRLAPLPPLRRQLAASAAARPVHGALMSSTRRLRAGRLCAEQQLYELLPDGRVAVFALPPGTSLDARSLVESALQVQQVQLPASKGEGGAAATLLPPHTVPPDAGVGKNQSPDDAAELARRFGGSMRLEISEQVSTRLLQDLLVQHRLPVARVSHNQSIFVYLACACMFPAGARCQGGGALAICTPGRAP